MFLRIKVFIPALKCTRITARLCSDTVRKLNRITNLLTGLEEDPKKRIRVEAGGEVKGTGEKMEIRKESWKDETHGLKNCAR